MNFLVWFLALGNIALIVAIVILFQKLSLKSSALERRNTIEQLKKYFSDHLSNGVNVNVLRKTVLDAKWPIEVVEQALRELGY